MKIKFYGIFAAACFFLLAALNILDMAFTSAFVHRYGTNIESNPIMYAAIDNDPMVFIIVKVAISCVVALTGLQWKRFKKWIAAAVAAPTLLYIYIVGMSTYYYITLPP